MNSEKISEDFTLPKYSEIPNVGLFLEQVSKYINEILHTLGQSDLTGSMISNYVKKDIIDNPVRKQYSRDQIAQLIFIALAKTVLSFEDITTMLQLVRESYDTETAYEYFRTQFPEILRSVWTDRELPVEDPGSDIRMIARNLSVTIACKIHLDMTFSEIRKSSR